MADIKPNQPSKPEQIVNVAISKREWNTLLLIRQCGFGKVVVQKMNNLIIRVEQQDSIVIDEDMEIPPKKGV